MQRTRRNNSQALVVRNNNQLAQRGQRQMRPRIDPTQLLYNWGLDAAEWGGRKAFDGLKGIVSAFQSRGASKQEIRSLVAPLAKSLTYTARQPKFTRAEGGLSIEHVENLPIGDAHNYWVIDSNLFNWLKNIANQFEEYQIQMWFAWNPICPATTAGKVMLAFDYDPTDSSLDYATAADYFNTADHCISAIWAPAAIAPTKSAWLKTGSAGDARLFSPGTLHLDCTTGASGFLTVKYQVALRKPQPGAPMSLSTFTGLFDGTTDVFDKSTNFAGNQNLIASVTATTLTIAPTSGYKLVTWSTNATIASIVPGTPTNAWNAGTRPGSFASFVMIVNPHVQVALTATVSAPVSESSFRVTVVQIDSNPLFFGF